MAPINSALHLNLALAKKNTQQQQRTRKVDGGGEGRNQVKSKTEDKRNQKHLSGLASLSPESKARERERKFYIFAAQMREFHLCNNAWILPWTLPAWTSSKATPAPFTETVLRISYAPILQPFRFRFQNYCQFALCQRPPPVSESHLCTSFDLFHTAWHPATAMLCNVRRIHRFRFGKFANLPKCQVCRMPLFPLQMDYV